MNREQEKGIGELKIFKEFVRLSGLSIIEASIEKREPHEPDIYCELEREGPRAFELVELADESLVREVAKAEKGLNPTAVWIGTNLHKVVKKFTNRYTTPHPMFLLCYHLGRSGLNFSIEEELREVIACIRQGRKLPEYLLKKPEPEYYVGKDGKEWMRFRTDKYTEIVRPVEDSDRSKKSEYSAVYKQFKSGKKSAPLPKINRYQFSVVWFMDLYSDDSQLKRRLTAYE